MDVKDLKKIALIAIMVFLLIGLMFFRKNEPANNNSPDNPVIITPEKPKIDAETADKNALKYRAEMFTSIYYSFPWGNFSNIESLYEEMSESLAKTEKSKVESMKNRLMGQPIQYQTQRSTAVSSEILSYDKKKADVNVTFDTSFLGGALVQRDTMVWVDRNGNQIQGDENSLIFYKEQKTIMLSLIKEGDIWKVDKIDANQ